MNGYKNGAIDPYTGAKISVLTNKLATEMYYEFTILETLKAPLNETIKAISNVNTLMRQTFPSDGLGL